MSQHHNGYRTDARPPRRPPPRGAAPTSRHPALPPLKKASDMTERGKVKFFDRNRGYGFVTPDSGQADVFVHAKVIDRYGIAAAIEADLPVCFSTAPNGHARGVEIDAIAIAT